MTDQEFLKHARAYINQHIAPHGEEIEESPDFPAAYLGLLGREKAFGITVPVAHGGLGLSPLVLKELIYHIALVSPTLALVMGVPVFSAHVISQFGKGALVEELLPKLCQGEVYCAFAYTETGPHSAPGTLQTFARPDPEGYILRGEKNMISLGGVADYYLTLGNLMVDPKTTRPAIFLVPKTAGGVSFGAAQEKMAFPGLALCDVFFKDVRLPGSASLGRAGLGLKIADEALQLGRLCVTTVALAMSQTAWEEAKTLVTRSEGDSRRLADYQAVQFMVAEMKVELEACRGLVETAWQHWSEDHPDKNTSIALAKIQGARTVMRLTDRVLQLFGGAGYLKKNRWERRFRQARVFGLVEGATEVLLNSVAQRLLRPDK